MDNTLTAVNIFFDVSIENYAGVLDFLVNYITDTDYCSLNRPESNNFSDLHPVYYIAGSIEDKDGRSYVQTVIPWVKYNSSEYFKDYIKENIEYSKRMNSEFIEWIK